MTHSEMSLAYTLFCIKYDGWNVRDIPNIRHVSQIEEIIFENMYIDDHRFGFIDTEYQNLDRYTFFFVSGNNLNLNRSGLEDLSKSNLNSYETLESFLKDFNISLKDIV